MTVTTEEKTREETVLNKEDLEYRIEIATQTLDRNIGFITNCDNKTSIVLAAFGVLLTIILTNEGLNEIFNIVKSCIETKTFCNIFYLVCFAGAIFVWVLGMFNLGSVLVAKTSEETIGRKDANSRIFFAGIRKSGDYKAYKQRFYSMRKEDILNDLIEQIYINADIASIKYNKYNLGLRLTIVGFFLFIAVFLIGIYIY
ncbi:MAG: Pycsar system effector family protein [Candidatus Fimenecus sp.]